MRSGCSRPSRRTRRSATSGSRAVWSPPGSRLRSLLSEFPKFLDAGPTAAGRSRAGMIDTTKLRTIRVLSAAALAMAGCSGTSSGQIPCVQDASCPNDYPVCGPAGKCIAGTSTSSTSVAVVGAEGHTAADFLSGTVRVLVTARAASGVQSVNLAVGSTNFSASATPAAPPLYAFDLDTTKLPNADASLTATLTAGDGSSATASGTLHVDNAKPAITTFTVAGAPTTTITARKVTAISPSFTRGVFPTLTSSAARRLGGRNGGSSLWTAP